jgi:NAD-dependent dihydropyrimidine dehydrogenase PreA subunit
MLRCTREAAENTVLSRSSDFLKITGLFLPQVIVNINESGRQYNHSMLKVHRDICGYCGCCVSVCPEGALELIDAYLCVEKSCTSCGICAKVCPLGALEVVHEK